MGKQLLYFDRRCHFLVMIVNGFEIDLPGPLNDTCTARKKLNVQDYMTHFFFEPCIKATNDGSW